MRPWPALFIASLLTAPALAEEAEASAGAVRLLALDLAAPELSEEERDILEGLYTNGLRGREGLLLITSDDVRARAPMEADRMDSCREELCLFELAEAVAADFVLFADVRAKEGGGLVLVFGLFDRRRAERVADERLEADAAAGMSGFVRPALDRVLSPALQSRPPSLLQSPLFLGGAALFATAGAAALGAGGYALELESALARPEVHRLEKARALEEGPWALAISAVAGAAALAGVGLMGLAFALE